MPNLTVEQAINNVLALIPVPSAGRFLHGAEEVAALVQAVRAEEKTVICDDCGFRYGAEHTVEATGQYECPLCELEAMRPRAEASGTAQVSAEDVEELQGEYDSLVVAWNSAVDSRCHEDAEHFGKLKSDAWVKLLAALTTEGKDDACGFTREGDARYVDADGKVRMVSWNRRTPPTTEGKP